MPWRDYKELKIWQKSMALVDEVYKLISKLPSDEKYALASQIRRAVVSVPSNIAEGNARSSQKEFVHFLEISKGSLFELDTQLMICQRQNYLTKEETDSVLVQTDELIKMLSKLIIKINETNS
ncbi:MAG: four helix bundle protein [Eubacterium sp.]|nr:four helix bundle protein [Eubacterium sp.]